MKCEKCGAIDSLSTRIFIDKNNNPITESELEAFYTLHPEAKDNRFKTVTLCGMCYVELKNSNQVIQLKWNNETTKKTVSQRKFTNYYVCSFCDTPNEALRNTCKECGRIRFSTEYGTKRVEVGNTKSSRRTKNKDFKKFLYIFVPVTIVLLYISLYSTPDKTAAFKDQKSMGLLVYSTNIHTWADGSQYEGELKNGKPHGKGTITWPNGDKYTGDFSNGQITGYGTYEWLDGAKYIGEVMDGQPHGQGTVYYSDGRSYSGIWVGGQSADSE